MGWPKNFIDEWLETLGDEFSKLAVLVHMFIKFY